MTRRLPATQVERKSNLLKNTLKASCFETGFATGSMGEKDFDGGLK